MYLSARKFRWLLNLYPPYLGAGVTVEAISPGWDFVRVSMKQRWYNTNAVGVHFGGSLYSMVDPHLMLMHMQLLGPDYIVWDKSATIDFLRPGKGCVTAEFRLAPEQLVAIRNACRDGAIHLPEYRVQITDSSQRAVATVRKTLYIRKRRKKRP